MSNIASLCVLFIPYFKHLIANYPLAENNSEKQKNGAKLHLYPKPAKSKEANKRWKLAQSNLQELPNGPKDGQIHCPLYKQKKILHC